MMWRAAMIGLCLLMAAPVHADRIVAKRAIKAQAVIGEADIETDPADTPGAVSVVGDAVGKEARVTIYPGQPLRPEDLAPPAIVDRNQKVTLAFRRGGLSIVTDGRSLARGGIGDTIRVMNSASKTTVQATLGPDGVAYVQ